MTVVVAPRAADPAHQVRRAQPARAFRRSPARCSSARPPARWRCALGIVVADVAAPAERPAGGVDQRGARGASRSSPRTASYAWASSALDAAARPALTTRDAAGARAVHASPTSSRAGCCSTSRCSSATSCVDEEKSLILRYEVIAFGASAIAASLILLIGAQPQPLGWARGGRRAGRLPGCCVKRILEESIAAEELNKILAMEQIVSSDVDIGDAFRRIQDARAPARRLADVPHRRGSRTESCSTSGRATSGYLGTARADLGRQLATLRARGAADRRQSSSCPTCCATRACCRRPTRRRAASSCCRCASATARSACWSSSITSRTRTRRRRSRSSAASPTSSRRRCTSTTSGGRCSRR